MGEVTLNVSSGQGKRSYGCSYGDGNPYDFVVITVVDSTTLFLCAPCFVRTALEMVQALMDPDAPEVARALMLADEMPVTPVPSPASRRRGHNAPAETEDDDLISSFDMVITSDELDEEFR